jgi:hypothetical protein
MSDKHFDYKFKGVPPTPQIGTLSRIAEEKAKEGSQLSFAQRVNALPEHDRKAIDKYLPTKIERLSSSKQREMLEKAIYKTDVAAVNALIKCGVDLNKRDNCGITPLAHSCRVGHAQIIALLVTNGADPNIEEKVGYCWTPLNYLVTQWTDEAFPKQDRLASIKLLLDHGADVNYKSPVNGETPLHIAAENKYPEIVILLLRQGANPRAKDGKGKRPKLQPSHFQGFGPYLTEALQQGKQSRIHRWIAAVERLLPVPKAASLLLEWAPLCSSDLKLSKEIHTIILDYLKALSEVDIEPPVDVAEYAKSYNAWFAKQEMLDKRQKILDDLAVDRLTTGGIGQGFSIQGKGYSTEKHGDLLIKLASNWAFDPDAFEIMDYVVGILNYVAKSAKEQNAPQKTRDALYRSVKELRNQLKKSADPDIQKRAKAIDNFLNPFNGPQ